MKKALPNFSSSKPINILYVDAGRGALINKALNAAEFTQRNIIIIALEKNPYSC